MLLRGSIFAFASQSAEHFLDIGAAGCKPHPIEPIPSPCPAASAHGYSRSFRAEPELAPAAASPAEQSTTCPKAAEVNRSCPLPLPSTAHCPGPVHRVSIASCLAPWTRPLPTSHRAEVSCLALWYKALPPVLFCLGFPFRHPRHSHSPAHHLYHLSTFLSPDPTTRRAHYCPRWDRLWYSTPPETLFTGDSIPK
jgi:hypothetical protein